MGDLLALNCTEIIKKILFLFYLFYWACYIFNFCGKHAICLGDLRHVMQKFSCCLCILESHSAGFDTANTKWNRPCFLHCVSKMYIFHSSNSWSKHRFSTESTPRLLQNKNRLQNRTHCTLWAFNAQHLWMMTVYFSWQRHHKHQGNVYCSMFCRFNTIVWSHCWLKNALLVNKRKTSAATLPVTWWERERWN